MDIIIKDSMDKSRHFKDIRKDFKNNIKAD